MIPYVVLIVFLTPFVFQVIRMDRRESPGGGVRDLLARSSPWLTAVSVALLYVVAFLHYRAYSPLAASSEGTLVVMGRLAGVGMAVSLLAFVSALVGRRRKIRAVCSALGVLGVCFWLVTGFGYGEVLLVRFHRSSW